MNKLKGLLSDYEIEELALDGMIAPFEPNLVREIKFSGFLKKVISYGASSYGYDLRLSSKEFSVFRHIPGTVINPKRFNQKNLEQVELQSDEDGDFFIIPGNSYGLGFAVEHLKIPRDVSVIFLGKSTYARCALHANVTPGEAGWCGHLTLEFSNNSPADCRIYANEGAIQAIFFRGEPCRISYADRAGKYQDQGQQIVLAKV